MSNMGSFQGAPISSILILPLFMLLFISQQSSASRLLLQEKTEEPVLARGNLNKVPENMQGRSHHKESGDEDFHCDRTDHRVSSTSHQDLRHRPDDCEDDSYRQFEDGDYIYTNSLP